MPKQLRLVLLALLPACAGGREAAPVARFDGDTLTAARLAEVLVLAQPLPIDEPTALELAHHWLEVSLIAARAAAGDSLLDPATIDSAMAPEFRERRIARLFEAASAAALERAGAIVDSVYAAGEVRLIEHVFRRVGPDAKPGEREVQRVTALRIHDQLKAGGSWSAAVERSEDPDSRGENGLIGLVRRAQLPLELDAAAFTLPPGAISSVIETRFGYHILRRPALAEARPTFVRLLAEEMEAAAEAEAGARLVATARLVIDPAAAGRTREMARDPWMAAFAPRTVLARSDRGSLGSDEVARALLLLEPAAREALVQASDVEVEGFLRELVLRDLLAAEADSAGITVDAVDRAAVEARYRAAIEAVWQAVGIAPDSLGAATAGAERGRLAKQRVDRYIEAVAARRTDLAAVPPLLTARLLGDEDWQIDTLALAGAIESARRMLAAAESR
ncbi:MAG: peptidylprolyl isomerase [Gemmatimonadota bacterium]|jgi:hypothetical protein